MNLSHKSDRTTDLAAAREALRSAERRLRTATEVANVGLWEVDVEMGEVWVSDQWGAMLGYGAEELPTTLEAAYALLHPDDQPRILQLLRDLRAAAWLTTPDLEYRMRARDGTWRWICARGAALECGAQDPLRRQAGVTMDITERKRAEARLSTSERLESMGRLAAGVAHEINTPIQYVSDSLYFIREGVQELLVYLGDAAGELDLPYLQQNLPAAVDRAVDGLARIAEIVRSLKDFSHADQASMSPVDLNRAIKSTLVVAKSEYKYVADLETDFADLPPVTCHGSQINQVVMNLVVNAGHAIAERVTGTTDKGLITVRTYCDDREVVICVSDTGVGIPESVRPRIFEPFFTTKEVGRGTGQGLAIARNVVHEHGGRITFQTQLNQGTTFFVHLPLDSRCDSAGGQAG